MSQAISIIGQRCASNEEIEQQVQTIVREFHPEKIILFGSYAKGQATPQSDVDLFVIIDSDRSSWQLSEQISLAVEHIFPMDIVVKTRKEVNKRLKHGDFFIEDIIKNGKVLYERVG